MSRDWSRRALLTRLAAVGSVGALAGCPREDGAPRTEERRTSPSPAESPSPTETVPDRQTPSEDALLPYVDQYDDVVDIAEAGADTTGDTSILPILEGIDVDDTLVYFPPGEYFVDGTWRVSEFENLGLAGRRATITSVADFTGPLFGLGGNSASSDLRIDGLTFDFRQANTGPRPLHCRVQDGLLVTDVTVRGEFDIDQDGLRFDVTDPDGEGVVRRLWLPDGGDPQYPNTGCYVGEVTRGHLRFEDCRIDGFPDNGLYASPATGRIDVVGGRYRNSGVSNVRVSGPATVRDVHVRCDEARAGVPNMRGIRLRMGTDVSVENCRVEMVEVTESDGAITCAEWLDTATIENTTVTIDTDGVPAVWAKTPRNSAGAVDEHVELRGLTIDGAAASGPTVRIGSRDGSVIEDVCICQSGPDRDGIYLANTSQATLRNSGITVTGEPLVVNESELTRQDIELKTMAEDGIRVLGSCDCS